MLNKYSFSIWQSFSYYGDNTYTDTIYKAGLMEINVMEKIKKGVFRIDRIEYVDYPKEEIGFWGDEHGYKEYFKRKYLGGAYCEETVEYKGDVSTIDLCGMNLKILAMKSHTRGTFCGDLCGEPFIVDFGGWQFILQHRISDFNGLELLKKDILSRIKKKRKSPKKPEIRFITSNNTGISYTEKKIQNVPFNSKYYTPETELVFKKINEHIKNDHKGLYMLHGEAGTGKTFFIRSLIKEIRKPVYFVPPYMIHTLSSPEFIKFMLTEIKDSVLILEDSEEALKRTESRSPAVSNLLNLSDGIVGDAVGAHIICTFNADLSEIDSALVRKGRLTLKHEFRKLPPATVKDIAGIEREMTLAEALNRADNGAKSKRKTIGF